MDDVITLFQDYKQDISQYKEHFPVIEEFKDVFGHQNLILQTDGSIQIKHYVGFFQKGKTKVQVLPKIYSDSPTTKGETEESLAFMFRLLAWSGYFSFKDLDDLDISTNKNNVFEIFIRIFIQRFINEFNKAPNYEYISRIQNQQIIKGKILFSETLKHNSYNNHQHIVEFDEFSIDNSLNQLFKFVIQELIKSTNDGKNKMLLKQGITLLEDVSTISLSPEFINSIQFSRQNKEYKTLFNFAKLFFYNNQPGLSSGKEHTFSFLVQLNILFEKSVLVFLQGIETSIPNIIVKYHNHKSFGKGNDKNRFMLEPDFLICNRASQNTIAILDTKFKDPFRGKKEPKIADSDLYQLSTYASAYNCHNLFVIYPMLINAPNKETLLTKYILKTPIKSTNLTLLQIDITEMDIELITERLISAIKQNL